MMASSTMPALLLAAGLGTRLAPMTNNIPKCLVPIHGKPLLAYWLDLLGIAGVGPIIINTHHHADTVREFATASPWCEKVRLVHEPELLGTGGTLLANRNTLQKNTFFVAHADNLSRFNFEDFAAAHRNRPPTCFITMMLFQTATPWSCGIVECDGRGVVTSFHEKTENPPSDLANAAVYLMEAEAIEVLERSGKKKPDLSLDLIPFCLGRIFTWRNNDYHRDVGTPESYAAALKEYIP